MPALANPKHEVFCHIVARGNDLNMAYTAAGYPGDPTSAKKLAEQPMIAERIAELKQKYAAKYRIVSRPEKNNA